MQGTLEEVTLRHDNSGLGGPWHVQMVEVANNATGVVTCFPCGEWIERSGGKPAEKVLKAGAPRKDSRCKYRVRPPPCTFSRPPFPFDSEFADVGARSAKEHR